MLGTGVDMNLKRMVSRTALAGVFTFVNVARVSVVHAKSGHAPKGKTTGVTKKKKSVPNLCGDYKEGILIIAHL